MSRECPNAEKKADGADGADGERKERYIPPAIGEDEESLFQTLAVGINFKKQASIPVKMTGEDCDEIKPIDSFEEPGFSETLMSNIKRTKYEIPTPVQKYSIPTILKKRDLMACAQTGSGKTAAYILPILKNILEDGIQSGEFTPVQTPQALILAPTRELAIQILTECRKFSFQSIIRSNILYGGAATGHQLNELSRGTNILVATPGRLLDIVNKEKVSLEKVKYLVLDEADRMLDLGFEGPVREILSKIKTSKEERCTFMFSATFPTEIQKLAQDFLNKYIFLTIGIVGGANTDVEQIIFKTTQFEKRNKLLEILNEVGNERIMIFLEHKKQADIIAFFLCQKNYPATSIHGDRLQSQRELALKDFKTGKSKIIVCTSVAARGLDISDVNHVINYDLPQTIDEYVHRIGRTGRCGNIGKAVSFFDSESDNDKKLARNLIKILQQAGKQVPDWLESLGDDALGTQFGGASGHTNDIRSFKSLAINDSKPGSGAAAAADEDW